MKKLIVFALFAAGTMFSVTAQDTMMKDKMKGEKMMKKQVEVISLEQTPGEFAQKNITVDEGTYVFEIKNSGVDHQVGFVLVKKGNDITKPENHIQTAYVTAPVEDGKVQQSQATKLEKGEYVYFCPLNPTATDNTLTVK